MPSGFLSDAERERLDGFPAQIVPGDIETYFTLSRADRTQIPRTTSAANRPGFTLQLGTLRFLGFCPDDLSAIPEVVAAYVARQLDEVCREIQAPEDGTDRLREREQELSGLLDRVEVLLAKGGDVRMEGNDVAITGAQPIEGFFLHVARSVCTARPCAISV